jgi:hypothetical protein
MFESQYSKVSQYFRNFIDKAIDEHPDDLLGITEFITISGYDIDTRFTERILHALDNNLFLYIDNDLIRFIGYNNPEIYKDRRSYIKLIRCNFKEYRNYKLLDTYDFKNGIENKTITYVESNFTPNYKYSKQLIIFAKSFIDSIKLLDGVESIMAKRYIRKLPTFGDLYDDYVESFNRLCRSQRFRLPYNNLSGNDGNREDVQVIEQEDKEVNVDPDMFRIITEVAKQMKNMELSDQQNNQEKKEDEAKRQRYEKFRKLCEDKKQLNSDGYIYIATNKKYASENIFKIGITTKLRSRKSNYRVGRIKEDELYYVYYSPCYCAKSVETLLKNMLHEFCVQEGSEMFCLHFSALKEIVKMMCDNVNGIADFTNGIIRDIVRFNCELDPLKLEEIPPPD